VVVSDPNCPECKQSELFLGPDDNKVRFCVECNILEKCKKKYFQSIRFDPEISIPEMKAPSVLDLLALTGRVDRLEVSLKAPAFRDNLRMSARVQVLEDKLTSLLADKKDATAPVAFCPDCASMEDVEESQDEGWDWVCKPCSLWFNVPAVEVEVEVEVEEEDLTQRPARTCPECECPRNVVKSVDDDHDWYCDYCSRFFDAGDLPDSDEDEDPEEETCSMLVEDSELDKLRTELVNLGNKFDSINTTTADNNEKLVALHGLVSKYGDPEELVVLQVQLEEERARASLAEERALDHYNNVLRQGNELLSFKSREAELKMNLACLESQAQEDSEEIARGLTTQKALHAEIKELVKKKDKLIEEAGEQGVVIARLSKECDLLQGEVEEFKKDPFNRLTWMAPTSGE
jgi:predicted XRE-type DNA-binding protein